MTGIPRVSNEVLYNAKANTTWGV